EAAAQASADRLQEVRARMADVGSQQRELAEQGDRKRAQAQELSAKLDDLARQLEEHRAQIPALTESQQALQQEADRIAATLHEEETQRDQVMPGLLAVEQDLMALSRTLQEQESRLAERTFRRTRILERLQEVYRIDDSQVLAEQSSLTPLTEDERQSLAAQVERLKAKLESMGPVSLGSVEEYDQLKQRLELLQTQQQDLLKAQEDLKHSIQQINRTARSQFRETFAKIQQEFQHYFLRLFNGGQADLILIDEDDVLESGIEIVARPPGKRPQSISLLSGGERALTATALLFALFKVRPSPFCILDEIDAPLDEANVDRFTKVLEEFLNLSQFILITHNKKTITKADCMYGVTMEQPGMSKIVSVKLTRANAAPALAPEAAEPSGVAA
ncbi:MAG: AAA family ATPase, partial [Candidatus Omnitrophica bacterium]|nr:AAA family ATPase [Candidatus Omnitrophota bacterium]